jgi:hypothetical protein
MDVISVALGMILHLTLSGQVALIRIKGDRLQFSFRCGKLGGLSFTQSECLLRRLQSHHTPERDG